MIEKFKLSSRNKQDNFQTATKNQGKKNSIKLGFIKEVIIWLICIIATSIGPTLLVKEPYSIGFTIFAIMLLIISSIFYNLILRLLKHPLISIFGLSIAYGGFLYFMLSQFSLKYFFRELFTIRLMEGIFSISMMHILWVIIIIKCLITSGLKKDRALNVIKSSFEYWAVIIVSIVIIRSEIFTNSGEGKMVMGNVFLLYIFLQQVIDTKLFAIINNRFRPASKSQYIN